MDWTSLVTLVPAKGPRPGPKPRRRETDFIWTLSDGTQGTTHQLVADPRNVEPFKYKTIWIKLNRGIHDPAELYARLHNNIDPETGRPRIPWTLSDGTVAHTSELVADPRNVHGLRPTAILRRLQRGYRKPIEIFRAPHPGGRLPGVTLSDGTYLQLADLERDPRNVHGLKRASLTGRIRRGLRDPADVWAPRARPLP